MGSRTSNKQHKAMSLKKLQELSGVTPDGVFGKNTFKEAAEFLGITNQVHAVHFFAQCAHESGNFKSFTENLNYSKKALRVVFGKYFKDDETASKYARKPEMIANRVYANRMGNGNEESGDGWRFRGRGSIQLTGKNNYDAFDKTVVNSVIDNPELVSDIYSFTSAKFFFDSNNLWDICTDLSEDTVKKLTRRINGGYNGIKHRLELTEKYSKYEL